jgi:hypothetical protein
MRLTESQRKENRMESNVQHDQTKMYFKQPDAPQQNSPVGRLIVRIIEKYPEMTCEVARAEANRLLAFAAKGRIYRFPQVRSAEEKAVAAERFAAWTSKQAVLTTA